MTSGMGIPNPLFFIGAVENNVDRRLEGRVQVRAFGIHGTVDEVPTEDLPWATLIIGSHDVNFVVPPLNSWVFGFFLDGRDAQQPMVLGLIPTQMNQIVDPTGTGWGRIAEEDQERLGQGSRGQDFGQPSNSRLARGEELDKTYNLPLETTRIKDIEIAGDGAPNLHSKGNVGPSSQDDTDRGPRGGSLPDEPLDKAAVASRRLQEDLGLSPEAAAGVMGNVLHETGQFKHYQEISPTVPGSRGGAGWLQWTGPRRVNFENWASSSGVDTRSDSANYNYIVHEMRGNDGNHWTPGYSLSGLRGITDPGEAARYFSDGYERPGVRATSARENYARQVYDAERGLEGEDIEGGASLSGPEPDPGALTDEERARYGISEDGESGSTAPASVSQGGGSNQVTWDEPPSAYQAEYPYNRVIETSSGHSIELDDTPGAERIMIYHENGSYVQLAPATTTYKSSGDSYDINEENHHVYVGGTNVITVEGDSYVLVKGNKVEEVQGDYQQIIHGNHTVGVAGQANFNASEEIQMRAARLDLESNVENLNLKTAKNIRFLSGETIHFKSKDIFVQAEESLNLRSENLYVLGEETMHVKGENVYINSDDSLYIKADSGYLQTDSDMSLKADNLFLSGTGETHIGTGSLVRISAGNAVDLNASVVNIDDNINMANGASSDATEASDSQDAEDASPAEDALPVELETPPAKNISNTPPSQET